MKTWTFFLVALMAVILIPGAIVINLQLKELRQVDIVESVWYDDNAILRDRNDFLEHQNISMGSRITELEILVNDFTLEMRAAGIKVVE